MVFFKNRPVQDNIRYIHIMDYMNKNRSPSPKLCQLGIPVPDKGTIWLQ